MQTPHGDTGLGLVSPFFLPIVFANRTLYRLSEYYDLTLSSAHTHEYRLCDVINFHHEEHEGHEEKILRVHCMRLFVAQIGAETIHPPLLHQYIRH